MHSGLAGRALTKRPVRTPIIKRVFVKSCGSFLAFLELWKHASQDLKPQIFLVAQPRKLVAR